MTKKKKVTPVFFSEISDLIPDEILHDAGKLSVWLALFTFMFQFQVGMKDAHERSWGVIQAVMYPTAAFTEKVIGIDVPGPYSPDPEDMPANRWAKQRVTNAKGFEKQLLTLMSDPFITAVTISAGFAFAGVYTLYETKAIEELAGGIVPGA